MDAVKVFDTDAHVEESEETFAAMGAEDRPRVIQPIHAAATAQEPPFANLPVVDVTKARLHRVSA